MDTLTGMRVFARVLDEGGFAKAARALGMSPALVSKYVAQLEDRLGVRLINRTTRRLSPTPLGRAYHARCAELVAEVQALEASLTEAQDTPRGLLRVAGPRALGEDRLVGSVAAFMARHPEVTVDLLLDERMVDIVAEGFDVVVRIGALEDSSLIAAKLTDYPYHLCATPEYLAQRGMPRTPDELKDHACILIRSISPTGQWRFLEDGKPRAVPVPAIATVNTARAAADLVRAHLGIGLCLPSTVDEDLNAGRLVKVLEDATDYDRQVYAIYPSARHLSAKVRLFVDHLRESFRGQVW